MRFLGDTTDCYFNILESCRSHTMKLGPTIKRCRQVRGMTLASVAASAGVSVSYLSLLERGERTDPGLETVEAIAEALHLPLSLLFFLAADKSELAGMDTELTKKIELAIEGLMERPSQ